MVAMPVVVVSLSVKSSKHCSGRQFSRLAVHHSFPRPPKDGLGHIHLVPVSPRLLSELSALTDISILPVTDDWFSYVLIRMVNYVRHGNNLLCARLSCRGHIVSLDSWASMLQKGSFC